MSRLRDMDRGRRGSGRSGRVTRFDDAGSPMVSDGASGDRDLRAQQMASFGARNDLWDREVQLGEVPPYPVRRPYSAAALGRYGVDPDTGRKYFGKTLCVALNAN
jgi:hypothetical protein